MSASTRALAVAVTLFSTGALLPATAVAASSDGGTAAFRGPVSAPAASKPATPAPVITQDDDFSRNARYARFYRQKLTWSASYCPKDSPMSGYIECARVKAPRDWYHAANGDITIGVSRLTGSLRQPKRARLLLSNPGGPGGTGIDFGPIAALFLGLTDSHTTIGIDPRGVGMSTNLLCPDVAAGNKGYLADGDSRSFTAAAVAADAADTAKYFAACAKARGAFLPYVNSDQTARDYNLVRALMGYASFDYYGVSYGTWLGAVLEKKFPSRVARLVLDGNVDWTSGSFDSIFASVPMSTQASYDRVFLPWLGRHNNSYGLGATAAEVNQTVEKLRAAAGRRTFGSDVTPDAFDAFLTGTLYTTLSWDETGMVLKGLKTVLAGDRSQLASLVNMINQANASDTASTSTYLAVRCNDTRAGSSTSTWFKAAQARASAYPLNGSKEMTPLCASWPYRPVISSTLMKRQMRGVLMLQTEADPVTGYDGALHTRLSQTGQMRMLAVDNAPGHGAGLLSSDCAALAAHNYLVKGTYPLGELACASTPIVSGSVADKNVYQFFNQSGKNRPLPAPYAYPKRDLSEPLIDPNVPSTTPVPVAAARVPNPGSLASPIIGHKNPWASALAQALADANQTSVAPTLVATQG